MATFDFNAWCTTTQLKEATVEALKTEDIDSERALKLLTERDVEELGLSVGQKRVLEAALKKLKLEEQAKTEPVDVTDPVTTKSLAKDGGLEEILKKIEGAGSLEDSLLALGSTDLFPGKTPAAENSSTLNSTLPRLDNDPHVFLGRHQKGVGTKQGEKPLLIPDFVNLGTYDSSEEEQEIVNNSSGAKIFFRATKAKPKLEQITLSMWVAANSRIMYQLLRKGKLSPTTSDIADYLAYTVKFAELLESHTLASALMYDNEYRKLQCEYGFRWGSDSQHLHTRFLVKRRSSVLTTNAPNSQKSSPRPNRQPQASHVTPIFRQFNSLTGCQWPNCRFQHVCLVPNCNQGHPQHEHHTISPA